MRSLGQFFLHFFVDLDISIGLFNLFGQRRILLKEVLGLLALVLQLSSQLVVLQDSQPGSGLKLFVVESIQVGFCLLDLVLHLLP